MTEDIPTTEPERGIGDNGGPALKPFTAEEKIERIREVLLMERLTAPQKCIGVAIIVEADADERIAAGLGTKRLKTIATVADRRTIYGATQALAEAKVAEPIKVGGKANNYRVLPPKVVDAIVEAYEAAKGSGDKPDQCGSNQVVQNAPVPSEPVRSNDTGTSEPVRSNDAGTVKPGTLNDAGGVKPPALDSTGGIERDRLPEDQKKKGLPPTPSKENPPIDSSEIGSPVERRPPKGDYTPLAHGAWLNCESIWHPEFSISIASAKMQFAMIPELSGSDVDTICKAQAIQWAAAIEGGQPASKVVPGNIIGALIGGARRGAYSTYEHKARLARVSGNQPVRIGKR